MKTTWLRWLASFVLLGMFSLPAWGQDNAPHGNRPEAGPPIAEFAVGGIATIVVLIVVCAPSRKR